MPSVSEQSPQEARPADPYRGVVFLTVGLAVAGTFAALVAAASIDVPALLEASVTLLLATGVVASVAVMQHKRTKPQTVPGVAGPPPLARPPVAATQPAAAAPSVAPVAPRTSAGSEAPAVAPPQLAAAEPGPTRASSTPVAAAGTPAAATAEAPSLAAPLGAPGPTGAPAAAVPRPPVAAPGPAAQAPSVARPRPAETELSLPGPVAAVLGATVGVASLVMLATSSPKATEVVSPLGLTSAIGVVCLLAAGLAAVVARYFAQVDARQLPERLGLARGARVVSWVLVLAAGSTWLAWAGRREVETLVFYLVLALNVALIGSLIHALFADRLEDESTRTLRLDFLVLELLGGRQNPVGSLLDSAERRLGVDLRSTWALLVVRRSVEPLLVALAVVGWLSTSLTRVDLDEQAVVETFGVRAGEPLGPGLHLHWPWPVSTVKPEHVLRVNGLTVGHEGEESAGPENVLWAVQHAKNEFVLVLGNGRDLITIDGDVQYRIRDIDAWLYHWRDPEKMLLALAYRAVMRETVDKTLSEALSQNIARLTAAMKAQIQADADALGLGVEVLTFTMGGMHPPVPVSAAYQRVVSAELARVTASVQAQSYRNKLLPDAEATTVVRIDGAKARAADAEARAAGDAWSFRTLDAQYGASPDEYRFRRRLETLEGALHRRKVTIIDRRIERDGGALWLKE